MEEMLKKWVVNDYFTPNIKAEVILDTLLTEYITEIVQGQLSGQVGKLAFLTKEMSILEEGGTDDRGSKIDYVLEDDNFVYLIELKTTKGSINASQASRYIENCYHQSFGTALGDKLLRIMAKKFPKAGSWTIDGLDDAFQNTAGKGRPCADKARRYLKDKRLASTYKYLYTVGQLLDNHFGEIRDLWQKPLKLIYLTPDGGRVFPQKSRKKDKQEQEDAERKWVELRLKWDSLYIGPNGADSSVSLETSALWLRRQDAYAKLLADIITELYGG